MAPAGQVDRASEVNRLCPEFLLRCRSVDKFRGKGRRPCAVEYLFGALAGSLTTGFATECARDNLEVDDIEMSLSGSLNNILAHLGLEEGDPSVKTIELKCFASTFDDEERSRRPGHARCSVPPCGYPAKAVDLQIKFVIV